MRKARLGSRDKVLLIFSLSDMMRNTYDVVYDVVLSYTCYITYDIVCDIVYDIVYDIVGIPHHEKKKAANQPDLVSGT